jgi:glycerol-3-phosphate dehydrogenase (NAD(P)+)
MKRDISVFGAGSMGTAVAILLAENGHRIKMWTPVKEEVDMINLKREQTEKLPGAKIPSNVSCTLDLGEAAAFSDIYVLVVPSQAVRESCKRLAKIINNKKVIACFSKGLEKGTGYRMSEVIKQELPGNEIVAMSGPAHAEELAKGVPTLYVAASESKESAELIQDCFISSKFRVYTNPDIIGVEMGGAIKNVIAICAGISDGLGFGDNTKAALMTRGIAEMSRLGNSLGAHVQTFAGLAGIGDLIVTCTSMHSRNRRAGFLIGQGKTPEQAIEEINMVVEGFYTTEPVYTLAKKLDVKMPIITEAYNILFENKDPRQAVIDLMCRDRKNELDDDLLNKLW